MYKKNLLASSNINMKLLNKTQKNLPLAYEYDESKIWYTYSYFCQSKEPLYQPHMILLQDL